VPNRPWRCSFVAFSSKVRARIISSRASRVASSFIGAASAVSVPSLVSTEYGSTATEAGWKRLRVRHGGENPRRRPPLLRARVVPLPMSTYPFSHRAATASQKLACNRRTLANASIIAACVHACNNCIHSNGQGYQRRPIAFTAERF